jgi:hypothetical protein
MHDAHDVFVILIINDFKDDKCMMHMMRLIYFAA